MSSHMKVKVLFVYACVCDLFNFQIVSPFKFVFLS